MFVKKTGLLLLCSVFIVVVVNAVPLEEEEEARTDHEQWVVSVPQGLERARRLAEGHDLQFLGEVIPETNLFHFSVKEHHRRKRSVLQNVHQSLIGHPGKIKINFYYLVNCLLIVDHKNTHICSPWFSDCK